MFWWRFGGGLVAGHVIPTADTAHVWGRDERNPSKFFPAFFGGGFSRFFTRARERVFRSTALRAGRKNI
jgi:hypothetical protein